MDKFFLDLEHVPIKNWIPSGLRCLVDSVSKKAGKMLLRCLDLEGLWSGHKFVLLWQTMFRIWLQLQEIGFPVWSHLEEARVAFAA